MRLTFVLTLYTAIFVWNRSWLCTMKFNNENTYSHGRDQISELLSIPLYKFLGLTSIMILHKCLLKFRSLEINFKFPNCRHLRWMQKRHASLYKNKDNCIFLSFLKSVAASNGCLLPNEFLKELLLVTLKLLLSSSNTVKMFIQQIIQSFNLEVHNYAVSAFVVIFILNQFHDTWFHRLFQYGIWFLNKNGLPLYAYSCHVLLLQIQTILNKYDVHTWSTCILYYTSARSQYLHYFRWLLPCSWANFTHTNIACKVYITNLLTSIGCRMVRDPAQVQL